MKLLLQHDMKYHRHMKYQVFYPESEEVEQQIYDTPYEDEENYGSIYSVPPSDIQKIYEEFEGKKLCKLYHTDLK